MFWNKKGANKNKCRHNPPLCCPLTKQVCPLDDKEFLNDLSVYVYKGRTPKAINLSPSDGSMNSDPMNTQIFRAAKAMIFFDEEMIDDFIRYDQTGKIKMTYRLCRQWRDMRIRWRTMCER